MGNAGGQFRFAAIESARAVAHLALPRPICADTEGGAEKGSDTSANVSAVAEWNLFPSMAATAGMPFDAVSNQLGRHFDSGATSVSVLPAAVKAVANRLEIILDGGIRSGADIVKAICLGATACSTARPFCYGLAAAGAAGVRSILIYFVPRCYGR